MALPQSDTMASHRKDRDFQGQPFDFIQLSIRYPTLRHTEPGSHHLGSSPPSARARVPGIWPSRSGQALSTTAAMPTTRPPFTATSFTGNFGP